MICPPKKEVSFIFYYSYFIGQPPWALMLWSNVSISSVTLGGALAILLFPHRHFYSQIQGNISIKSGKRPREKGVKEYRISSKEYRMMK